MQIINVFNKYHLKHLDKAVLEVNNIEEIIKIFKWSKTPQKLNEAYLNEFEGLEDLNQRRLRDAELLATIACNINGQDILEIGTASGMGTALLAENAPESTIFTINILPEEIKNKKGGGYTTYTLEKEKIGTFYKQKGLKNIEQIYANTLTWKPHLQNIGLSFIDGCHDTDFVINDTLKSMQCMVPGSFILWHDFHPGLIRKYGWIFEVCRAVDKLIAKKIIKGRVFHLKDSWMGLYQIQ